MIQEKYFVNTGVFGNSYVRICYDVEKIDVRRVWLVELSRKNGVRCPDYASRAEDRLK